MLLNILDGHRGFLSPEQTEEFLISGAWLIDITCLCLFVCVGVGRDVLEFVALSVVLIR